MQREVTHVPFSTRIGVVTNPMSVLWEWEPVVMNVSCEITTSDPRYTWS
jgi:hypothetical protein